MRHIKLFEKFDQYDYWHYASMSKIKQDINDMFIELIDEGFKIDIHFISTLQLYINKKNDWFYFDDIYETLLMLIDYVENEFEDVDINFFCESYNDGRVIVGTYTTGQYNSGSWEKIVGIENKHFLVSYFTICFGTGNKKLSRNQ